jgi:hypothetical protein
MAATSSYYLPPSYVSPPLASADCLHTHFLDCYHSLPLIFVLQIYPLRGYNNEHHFEQFCFNVFISFTKEACLQDDCLATAFCCGRWSLELNVVTFFHNFDFDICRRQHHVACTCT